MAQKYFIGDLVTSYQYGTGYVEQVDTWMDVIVGMSEPEIVEFGKICKQYYGENFIEEWHRLHVLIDGVTRTVESLYVEIVEQRPIGG